MSAPESRSRVKCRNGMICYMVLAMLLASAFGYSIAAWQNVGATIKMTEQARLERMAQERRHKADKDYLRDKLAESKAVIISLAQQSAKNNASSTEATKAAVEIIKQNVEAKP